MNARRRAVLSQPDAETDTERDRDREGTHAEDARAPSRARHGVRRRHAREKENERKFRNREPVRARVVECRSAARAQRRGGVEFFGEYGCCVAESQSERPFGARMD